MRYQTYDRVRKHHGMRHGAYGSDSPSPQESHHKEDSVVTVKNTFSILYAVEQALSLGAEVYFTLRQ